MKIKSVLCGVIIGLLLTSGFFVVAEEALTVAPNPFKITVDGEAKNIEGYNINGSTYFKLRDVGNEVGFSVDFKEDTIMIETSTPSGASIATETTNTQKGEWIDFNTYMQNSVLYYRFVYYNQSGKLFNTRISGSPIDNGYELVLIQVAKNSVDKKSKIVLKDIEHIVVDNAILISEDYFNEVILPIDKSLSE